LVNLSIKKHDSGHVSLIEGKGMLFV